MADAHWTERLADQVQARAAGAPIVCASGISPSGPIHVGNLREVFTTHLVAEALRRRDLPVTHLHSWDDYDRFRKVPAGVDPAFNEYEGMPLAAIPDPWGEKASYADHFIDEFVDTLHELGIEMEPRRQSELYPAGTYNAAIRQAMNQRELVFDTLAAQQTESRQTTPVEERRAAYYPFKPFCETCGRDWTTVTGWSDPELTYTCNRCGIEAATMRLADGERISGKLVWKVDWPMRWKHEGVTFEPAGEDHHAPTGSFTVGRTLVADVFGGAAPETAVYSFVRLAGVGGKMSGSVGGVVTPGQAIQVLEPPILRWQYVQRPPATGFSIDVSPKGVQRTYDHWDQYVDNAEDPTVLRASISTTVGDVHRTTRPVSFRLLSSVADLTQGNHEQIGRIVNEHLGEQVPLDDLEPRLSCAIHFATEIVPPDQRTIVRDSFNAEAWAELTEDTRRGIGLLADGLRDDWSVDGLTALVYGVPKQLLGLPPDADASPELKAAQRDFFKAVYRLLCSKETGPRLPTFILSVGADRIEPLLRG